MPPSDRDEADEERTCDRCGARFWFRVGEQRFFAQRGLADAPRRCAACRRARKLEARRGPARSNQASQAGAPQAGALKAREMPPGEMTPSVTDEYETARTASARALPRCAWCGAEARVPFHVAAHRPVACEACYRWRLGVGSGLTED